MMTTPSPSLAPDLTLVPPGTIRHGPPPAAGEPSARRLDESTRPEDGSKRRTGFVIQRQQRRPYGVAVEKPHQDQGGLRRDRVRATAEVRQEQRQPAFMMAPRRFPVA